MFPAGDGRVHSTEVVDTKVIGSGTPSTKHPSPHVSFLKCSPCTRMLLKVHIDGRTCWVQSPYDRPRHHQNERYIRSQISVDDQAYRRESEHGCLLQDRGLFAGAVVAEMYVPVVRAPSVELEFLQLILEKGVLNWHSIALFMEIPTP